MSEINPETAKKNARRMNYITSKYVEYCDAPPNREKFIINELLDYIADICTEEGVVL